MACAALVTAVVLTAGLVATAAGQTLERGQAQDDEGLVPGNGQRLVIARPTWDTGWFQAEVMAQVLAEAGYLIDGPSTYDNAGFYAGIEAGTIDLWVNGWFPSHDVFLTTDSTKIVPVGFEVKGGALQGYMVDKRSADELGIETLADLADREVAARFDTDGDGKADLIGCNQDWACHAVVEHQLEAFGLTNTVKQVSAEYGPLMEAAARRYASGSPILYFNFTPNWTNGVLVPGRDVAWVPVPFAAVPDGLSEPDDESIIAGVTGCITDPCNMGFPPNDIRAVANRDLLDRQPAVVAILTEFTIPLADIAEQNASMFRGEDSEADIEARAAAWIEANRAIVNRWLDRATEAHVEAGGTLAPPPPVSDVDALDVGTVRVATRPAAPFVIYEDNIYGGFTIELLRLVAAEVGAELDIYGVTTNAKLIDDVARGEAEVGAGAVAFTSQRERRIDFSQSYFDAGLEIMVPQQRSGVISAVLRTFLSRDLLLVIATLMLALFAAAHVIWLAERHSNPDFPVDYRSGIWEAFWWAAVTATTVGYGDKTPTGKVGRIFGLFWMFVGLFLLAYFTAGIASAVAIDRVEGQINGPEDLRRHDVGVVADSLADDYLGLQGIRATEYVGADEAYAALRSGSIDAVVHDAAVLQHYVGGEGRDDFDLVGLIFAERGLGFVVDSDTDMDEALNRGLIAVVESGQYDDLYDRWFGIDD